MSTIIEILTPAAAPSKIAKKISKFVGAGDDVTTSNSFTFKLGETDKWTLLKLTPNKYALTYKGFLKIDVFQGYKATIEWMLKQ